MTPSGNRRAVLAGPWLWSLVFFLLPLAIIVKISLAQSQAGVPPYTPLFDHGAMILSLDNYRDVLSDDLYLRAYWGSLKIAALATGLCLLVGYPMAYAMARAPQKYRGLLLLLVVLPFWTSLLVRIYAWIGLLRPGGLVNETLLALGLIQTPLHMLNTNGAVCLGIVYAYLPFMILPLYARLEKLDPTLREAASDLGARPGRVFLSVTLPLSLPGIVAGALLVFIPAVGEFVIPDLVGGPDTLMIGKIMWSTFFSDRDWPMAAALTVIMVAVLVIPILALQHAAGKVDAEGAAP